MLINNKKKGLQFRKPVGLSLETSPGNKEARSKHENKPGSKRERDKAASKGKIIKPTSRKKANL